MFEPISSNLNLTIVKPKISNLFKKGIKNIPIVPKITTKETAIADIPKYISKEYQEYRIKICAVKKSYN